MVCLPGKGTVHFSTNCMKIINIGESTPLEVFWLGCELTTSNFQPKRSSFERRQPEQEKQQGMRMLTVGSGSAGSSAVVLTATVSEENRRLFRGQNFSHRYIIYKARIELIFGERGVPVVCFKW